MNIHHLEDLVKITTMSTNNEEKKNIWEDLNRLSEEELKRHKGA